MSIRIALMLTGILVVTSSCGAQAALQPMDPAHAPVAAVDRFSDKAGTLLRRSTETASRAERADRFRHRSPGHPRLIAHR